MRSVDFCFLVVAVLAQGAAYPETLPESGVMLGEIVVTSDAGNPIGAADTANEGTVTARQLANRPLLRTGELLEAVPGVIVTQHSGDGKANQYFARGFNLDHGTDFRTTVLGMPVNMPTHAHGQGYTDLNFVIPELISAIRYQKGTYFAEAGDFSAAGSASFDYVRTMPQGLFSVEAGQRNYRRVVLADSAAAGPGDLLYAFEGAGQDGPWEVRERYRRFNGVLSYSLRSGADDLRLSAMALQSSWNATDQVPQRALDAGLLGRFGAVDPSDGGSTSRYSLSADWTRNLRDGAARMHAYLIRSRLDLFSDFTYALNDPVHGDQFNQAERRTVAGLNAERTWSSQPGGLDIETTVGVQLRQDLLAPVALYTTQARERLATIREDRVREQAAAVFVSNTARWLPWFRTVAGARFDRYAVDVASSNPANSGQVIATIVSPKFSAIFTPEKHTELYLNWGQGFHSNDARGMTAKVDPATGLGVDDRGDPIRPATPLVKATGKEVGIRYAGLLPGLQTSLSAWQLDLASELVFAGDAGTTEAGRPSHRTGVEFAANYAPASGWLFNASLAWSRARFADGDPAGPYIPGALDRTASIGLSGEQGRWSGGVQLRYLGGRALVEDNSARSSPTTLLNAKLGYALTKDVQLTVEALNLLDRQVSDIDYYYVSRLRGEALPVADIHTHPAEPRTLRIGARMKF